MNFKIFSKKPQSKKAFGNNIEPDCLYCVYNNGENEVICNNYTSDVCQKYVYDPLKRPPKTKPPLKKYTKDDFAL